jgi:hypothetical protein
MNPHRFKINFPFGVHHKINAKYSIDN